MEVICITGVTGLRNVRRYCRRYSLLAKVTNLGPKVFRVEVLVPSHDPDRKPETVPQILVRLLRPLVGATGRIRLSTDSE